MINYQDISYNKYEINYKDIFMMMFTFFIYYYEVNFHTQQNHKLT